MNKKLNRKQNKRGTGTGLRSARFIVAFVLGVVFLSGVAVFASKGGSGILSYLRPEVKVSLSGEVGRDEGMVSLDKAGSVKPGELIKWKIRSENTSDSEAKGYKAIGNIPPGTEFVAGSANGDGLPALKYSIDGGQNFSEKPMIKRKNAEGKDELVAAPASMYTQVRFEW
ncbi:MAG: hypothetical protein KDB79_11410, partial [Acidobacteria bacterium]|nr:hypothetical protein [Acidobacteriota bacterium]